MERTNGKIASHPPRTAKADESVRDYYEELEEAVRQAGTKKVSPLLERDLHLEVARAVAVRLWDCRGAHAKDVCMAGSAAQVIGHKLPPLLSKNELFTRAVPNGVSGALFYSSPSNRIGMYYSPQTSGLDCSGLATQKTGAGSALVRDKAAPTAANGNGRAVPQVSCSREERPPRPQLHITLAVPLSVSACLHVWRNSSARSCWLLCGTKLSHL